MSKWSLPESLLVGGKSWPIRSDFRCGLDAMVALQADDLTVAEKADCICRIIFPDWREIYAEGLFSEAVEAAYRYLDCGRPQNTSGRQQKPVVFWDTDAPLIFDAINKTRGKDVRTEKMHWWTFCGLYMEIGQSTFADVISIRQKRAKGKKLEKTEKEFMRDCPQYFQKRENKHVMDDIQEYIDLLK